MIGKLKGFPRKEKSELNFYGNLIYFFLLDKPKK